MSHAAPPPHGDLGRIGVLFQIVGETLCETVDLRSTDNVLDVDAGDGNASLAAARRHADVTATDAVPEPLERGVRRADAEDLLILTRVADAGHLPFRDGEFDVALSTFGVMFEPEPERAAAELIRVVGRGGRIGLASWTPEGFVGELLRVVARFVAPAAGTPSPTAWGTETRIVELFGTRATDIRTGRRQFVFRNLSPEHWIQVFRRLDGIVRMTFDALDPDGQKAFHADLVDLLARYDRGGGESLVVPGDYLEVLVRCA